VDFRVHCHVFLWLPLGIEFSRRPTGACRNWRSGGWRRAELIRVIGVGVISPLLALHPFCLLFCGAPRAAFQVAFESLLAVNRSILSVETFSSLLSSRDRPNPVWRQPTYPTNGFTAPARARRPRRLRASLRPSPAARRQRIIR